MNKIKGVHTALITPFDENFRLDEEALRENISFQLKLKVDGLVLLGTTGETPTLKPDEKKRIVEIAFEERRKNKAEKDTLITIGTGCYCTESTIESTKRAKELGADAALIVTPYYNKPTQKGLFSHFELIAKNVNIPIIVYNIAGRTGQNIQTDTLKRLSNIPNIIGVKEASGNILQMMDVYQEICEIREDFCLLSGDDSLTLPLMSIGGHGVISVVSNLLPDLVKKLTDHLEKAEYEEAKKLHYQLLPLFKAAFIETNPIPIKFSMNHFGMKAGKCRLPLCELLETSQIHLKEVLDTYEKSNLLSSINSYFLNI